MKEHEARAVITALEGGQQFHFESYSADAREVLEYDAGAGCFVLRTHHAYDPDVVDKRIFTRDELYQELRERFSYADFRKAISQGQLLGRQPQFTFIYDQFAEVIEDAALANAIAEGEKSGAVDPKEIFDILDKTS